MDGKIEDMTPVVNDANNRIGFYGTYGSLAWDHDKDVLYMIGSSSGPVQQRIHLHHHRHADG